MRLVVALASVLLLSSCGSPTGPSYPAVDGTWTGTFQTANFGTHAIQLTLQQSKNIVNGTWTADGDWNGTLSGLLEVSGTFSATMTNSVPGANGGARCAGTATMGGAFTSSLLTLGTNGFAGNCAGLPTDITMVTHR